jgi:pantoate--beta-alanine ligase
VCLAAKMKLIESVSCMRAVCRRLVRDGTSIRFVPTMGALHDGHSSLIERALHDNDDDDHDDESADNNGCRAHHKTAVIVSIFANPMQFNDRNDFVNYPHTIESDLKRCEQLEVDYVFAPKCEDIYQFANQLASCDKSSQQPMVTTKGRCTVKPPRELAQILEGKSRGDHFEGMLTIVCKLFNIIQPKRAYFGLKDYQQLVLVTRMVQDLNLPVEICGVETVRELETNLPLSSRNVRLDSEQKRLASQIMYDTLVSTKLCLEDKCRRGNQLQSDLSNSDELNSILLASLITSQLCLELSDSDVASNHYLSHNSTSKSTQITVDYFELRCAKDLSPIDFDHNLAIYDCQRGCVKSRHLLLGTTANKGGGLSNVESILEARLLIAILVSKVRLLDNIGVQMNLSLSN